MGRFSLLAGAALVALAAAQDPSPDATTSPTGTPSVSPTLSVSPTPSVTSTTSVTPTVTRTASVTVTPTRTVSATQSATRTVSPTTSPTRSATSTSSPSAAASTAATAATCGAGIAPRVAGDSPAGAALVVNAGTRDYATNKNSFVVIGSDATKPFVAATGGVITRITNAAAEEVQSKVLGAQALPVKNGAQLDYVLDMVNLPEGKYTFNNCFNLLWDKTAPVGMDSKDTTLAYIGDAETYYSLPSTLFTDALSNAASKITITGAKALGEDNGFMLEAANVPLSQARLKSTLVRGPATAGSRFEITAVDEAGNEAKAIFSFPVAPRVKSVLTVADGRGASSAVSNGGAIFFTGASTSLTSGALVYDVTLSFPDKMMHAPSAGAATNLAASDLSVTIPNAVVTPVDATMSTGYSFKYQVTVSSTNAVISGSKLVAGSDYVIGLPATSVFKRASDMAVSDAGAVANVFVSVRNGLIGSTESIQAPTVAVVGMDYFWYLPTDFANTFANIAGKLEIVSATSAQAGAGLRVVPGPLGRAFIAGRISSAPALSSDTATITNTFGQASPAAQVVFIVTVRDASGATATAPVSVKVATSVPNLTAYTISLPSTPFEFKEVAGAQTAASVGTVTETKTGIATIKYNIYLETPQDTSNAEILAATAGTYSFDAEAKVGTLAAATSSAVTYVNNYEDAVSTDSTNRRNVRIVSYVEDSGSMLVVGTALRAVNFVVFNDVPTIAITTTAVTFTENGVLTKVALADAVTIADADDKNSVAGVDAFRGATVKIDLAKCDTKRDSLALVGYTAGKVSAVYSVDRCTLTIGPIAGTTISSADLKEALQAVNFVTSDPKNPNGFSSSNRVMAITFVVTDNASNSHVAAPASSAAATVTLTVAPVASQAEVDKNALYGMGGIASNPARDANNKVLAGGIVARKFRVIAQDTTVLSFDFNKDADQYYANGAIFLPDLKDTPVTGPSQVTLTATGGVALKAYPANVMVGTLSTVTSLTAYPNTQPALWYVVVDASAVSAATEGKITFTYGTNGPTFDVWFDVLVKKCPLDTDFDRTTHVANGEACYNPAGKPISGLAANTNFVQKIAPSAIGTNGLDLKTTTINGRGDFKVNIPKNSVAVADQIEFMALPVPKIVKDNAPPAPTGTTVDIDAAIKLEPAGTTFTIPVAVTINTGAAVDGFKYVLGVSSQVDATDVSKGFTKWEILADQTYDATTGQVTASVSHFSVIAPILVPIPTSATQSKIFNMGASCPNECSGKGYCREEGKCVCFDGFTGYDCSLRTCPSDQSWDVPMTAASTIVHQIDECSGRGACDRKTGECVCEPGFQGSACQRVACPSDCSGHGKCRLVASANSWENGRIQQCVCDGGYTGPDCSQRICAFGDDPETVCHNDVRQVQRLTLDFGTLPTGVSSADFTTLGLYDNDEISVMFKTMDNAGFSTPVVANIYDGDASAAAKLKTALKVLPNFAISDVDVNVAAAQTTPTVVNPVSKVSMSYDITFSGSSLRSNLVNGLLLISSNTVADNTVSGNQNTLTCNVANDNFVTACNNDGCRPKTSQPRLLKVTSTGTAMVTVNADSNLMQPSDGAVVGANWANPSVWGVEATVTINSDGTKATYSVSYSVYGIPAGTDAEMPVPPTGSRSNVPLRYGLHVDFPAGTIASGASTTDIKYRLPKCTVDVVQKADTDYEVYECSNRGICDRKSGTCTCFNGYSGYNCGQQTIIL